MATSAPRTFAYRGRTLEIDGRSVFLREAVPFSPRPEALILLHGWVGTSSWMFDHLMAELGARYHTIAPVLPGFGRSRTLADVPSIDGYAEFLRRLADELEIDRFHLVGVSVGGTVALTLADRYPERVRRLALQGPVYRAADLPRRFRLVYEIAGRTPLIELIPKAPLKWWFFVRRLDMGRDTRHLSAADRRQLGRDILRVPNETLVEVGRELLTLDLTDVAKRVRLPTLVLDGSEARLVPAKASRRLARLIPGARCRIVRDSGHNLALEKPREFLEALLPFLAGET
ncbi:MAG TPA: alpha/beta hydrolase [Dehalococcoidia bacterium]|nr:alpha/beta hydrolase [Dehalococcoidia bacterium]